LCDIPDVLPGEFILSECNQVPLLHWLPELTKYEIYYNDHAAQTFGFVPAPLPLHIIDTSSPELADKKRTAHLRQHQRDRAVVDSCPVGSFAPSLPIAEDNLFSGLFLTHIDIGYQRFPRVNTVRFYNLPVLEILRIGLFTRAVGVWECPALRIITAPPVCRSNIVVASCMLLEEIVGIAGRISVFDCPVLHRLPREISDMSGIIIGHSCPRVPRPTPATIAEAGYIPALISADYAAATVTTDTRFKHMFTAGNLCPDDIALIPRIPACAFPRPPGEYVFSTFSWHVHPARRGMVQMLVAGMHQDLVARYQDEGRNMGRVLSDLEQDTNVEKSQQKMLVLALPREIWRMVMQQIVIPSLDIPPPREEIVFTEDLDSIV
jgi:hypothetical protein